MRRNACIVVALLSFSGAAFLTVTPAAADPLPGEILKFQQLPLNNGGALPTPYVGPYISPNVGPPFPAALPPLPLQPLAPFPGHDELSTAYANQFNGTQPIAWAGTYMADDFADRFTSPVVHVRWWGSYLQNQRFTGVQRFLISFESDVAALPPSPANPNGVPSRPGSPLLNQIVTLGPLAPGSGTYTETPVPTPTAPVPPIETLYQYNAELNLGKEFPELANTVYWLKIVALVDSTADGPIQWGWHDRDWMVPDFLASVPPAVVPGEGPIGAIAPFGPVWHFQDDAVSGAVGVAAGAGGVTLVEQTSWTPQNYVFPIDGPDSIQNFSKDLAFELYTIPEPGTLAIVGMVAIAFGLRHRRREVLTI